MGEDSGGSRQAALAGVGCARCGYSLAGSSGVGRCPECGAALALTMHPWRYDVRDPAWLRHVGRGIALLLAARVLWVGAAWALAAGPDLPTGARLAAGAVIGPRLWAAGYAAAVAEAAPVVLVVIAAALFLHGLGLWVVGAGSDAARDRAVTPLRLPLRAYALLTTGPAVLGLVRLVASGGAGAPLVVPLEAVLLVAADAAGSAVFWFHARSLARIVRRYGIEPEAATAVARFATLLGDGVILAAVIVAAAGGGDNVVQLLTWSGLLVLCAAGVAACRALLVLHIATLGAAGAGERMDPLR